MYIKPKVSKDDLGVNPFSVSLVIPCVKYTEKNKRKFDEGIVLPSDVVYDKSEKTNVYTSMNHRLLIAGLTSPAQRLFLWLMQEIKPGKDYVIVNVERYMTENSIKSINTYSTGRKELQVNGVICSATVPTVFWINPAIFFNGSRIKAFPNNINTEYDYSEAQ